MLGISDHGPKRLVAGRISYFRSLAFAQPKRLGVRMLYGAEVNILDQEGKLDLDDEILESLDYVIASMHRPIFKSGTADENTRAYIKAMENPNVNIIGHCDERKIPCRLFCAFPCCNGEPCSAEINNSSLSPDGYRGDTTYADLLILNLIPSTLIIRFCSPVTATASNISVTSSMPKLWLEKLTFRRILS